MSFDGLPSDPFRYIASDFDSFFRVMLDGDDTAKTADYFSIATGLPHGIANLVISRSGADLNLMREIITPRNSVDYPTAVAILEEPIEPVAELINKLGWAARETIHCMAADLDTVPKMEIDRQFQWREVDQTEHAIWVDVMSEGYELPRDFVERIGPAAPRITDCPDNIQFKFFLASEDGVPASTSVHMITDGIIGVYDVSTRPIYRGRGLGRFVTLAPLIQARDEGYKTALLQASEMGAPIYEKIGFESVGTFPLYFNREH